jgi:hypothetical protein
MKSFTKVYLTIAMLLASAMLALAITAPVVVNTYDSQGNTLATKFKVWKGPNYVGEFDAGTAANLDVGATYTLFAHYENTSTARQTFVVDPAGNTFSFSTTNVTFHWSGGYLEYYGSGSWRSFGQTAGVWNSRELFPRDFSGNIMQIHIGYKWNDVRGMTFTIDYEGMTSIEKVLSQLRLLDHLGNPLEGGTARGGYASPTSYFVSGSTNAAGLLLDIQNGSNENRSFEMKYNNTTSWSAQQMSSIYDFQTQLLTLRVETCNGLPIDGAAPAFGYGTNAGGWWFPGGNTGSAVPGESSAEVFPGTYSFRMQYKATQEIIYSWNFPTDGATVTWKTTKVTLNYPGTISYGGASGTSTWFTKPSMELLAGTYKFKFTGASTTDITLTGCNLTYAAARIKLINSTNVGLQGGDATYYQSGWKSAGTTDANGDAFVLIDATATKYSFRMNWAGYSQQLSNVDIMTTNPVIFQTVPVLARLEDSNGNDLAGGVATYYASGWKALGTTAANGNTPPLELLPGTYSFRMAYLGYSEQKSNISVPAGSPVVFATVPVIARLEDSNGNDLAGGVATYYASGWKTLGTTAADGNTPPLELLPGNYSFRMAYLGYSQQKSNITVPAGSPVVFATMPMLVSLQTCNNVGLEGGVVTYYASGWKSFGTTDVNGNVSMELLPGSYSFRMSLGGQSNQQSNINITTVNPLIFNTTNVALDFNGSITYYASGWKSFTQPSMEMLPQNYTFRFGKNQLIINVAGCNVNRAFVLLTLRDENNQGVEGGQAMPAYGGSWGTTLPGVTDASGKLFSEITPGYTKIKMTVNQGSEEQLLPALLTSNYTWTTEILRVRLIDHSGIAITDGTGILNQGGGFWYYWGNLNASGYFDVALFARTSAYKFKLTYNYTSQEKLPVVSVTPGIDNLYFQTGQVFGACITEYSTGSWRTFTDGMELMPGTYTFRTPSQSGVVVAGAITNLNCPTPAKTDVVAGLDLMVYPNPATDNVSFLNYEGSVEIYNATGLLMYHGSDATINVANWQSGLYIVKSGDQVVKFIKR